MTKRTVRGWQRIELEPAKAGELFRQAGFTPTDIDPSHAWAHRDRQGRCRRMHATWAQGWRATLTLRLDGDATLSYVRTVAHIRLVARI